MAMKQVYESQSSQLIVLSGIEPEYVILTEHGSQRLQPLVSWQSLPYVYQCANIQYFAEKLFNDR